MIQDLILSDAKTSVVTILSRGTTYVLTLHRLSLPLVRYVYGNAYQKTESILSGMKKSFLCTSHHETRSDILGFISSSFD